jgi:hypothetical protein
VAEGDGLLNADQPVGHFRFSSQIKPLNKFLDRASWLLLAPEALFWRLTGTIVGTAHSAGCSTLSALEMPS